VPIFRDRDSKVVKSKALEVAEVLRKSGLRVIVDEREEYTSGWKFNEWEVKGVPLRINLGPRDIENAQVELVRRDTMQKSTVNCSILVDSVFSILNEIQTNLLLRTKEILRQYMSKATSYDSFKSILDGKGGFVYTGWCGDQSCETKVKEETGADLRVLPFDEQQETGLLSNCVYCRQPANKIAVFARAY
jgi:prolyl-tRNA synthetase